MKQLIVSGCLVLAFLSPVWSAENVLKWRGENGGKFDLSLVQTSWSKTKNIKWKTPLPGTSNASPIIVGDKIFICSEPASIICLDRNSGKILWQKSHDYLDVMDLTNEQKKEIAERAEQNQHLETEVGELESKIRRVNRILKRKPNDNEAKAEKLDLDKQIAEIKSKINDQGLGDIPLKPKTHKVNGYTSYTPVSDGKTVFVCSGLGTVAAYDLDGQRLWAKKLSIPDHNNWGGSTTPVLAGGNLIVRFKDWVGLDPETGQEKWRTPAHQCFGTPLVFQVEGKDILFSPKGDVVGAADGKLYAQGVVGLAENAWWVFNLPILENGVIYTNYGVQNDPSMIKAFEVPKSLNDLKSGLKLKWEFETERMRFYSSMIMDDGLLYALGHEFALYVFDADNGDVIHQQKLEGFKGTAYPSMSLVGDYLFVSSDAGQTQIIKPGKKLEVVTHNELEPFRSTPVFLGNAQYLRGYEHFYVIE
ncbi:MAG: PQQ-binding-like beta-propeller repeat protein [Verrucomicrobiota bacterium]